MHHSLAKRSWNLAHVASPIRRKHTALDIPMEAAVRPIGSTRDVSMLYRVEVNVVDMTSKIFVAANGVFPISALPDSFFSLGYLTRRPQRGRIQTARKAGLDQAPARREVGVVFGHFPERVKMIRQNADRDGFKRAALLSNPIRTTEAIDFIDQQLTAAVRESDREKENAAFGSTVLRHGAVSKGDGGQGARAPLPTLRHRA